MRVCVTGGAGYIGSHAVKMLKKEGHEVIVIDNLSTGYKDAVDKNVPFYEVDTHNFDALIDIFKSRHIDSVMHFAAFSLVGESVENPLKYYQNNVEGTRILLSAMHHCNIDKMIFSSTAAVYGFQPKQPIDETCIENPENTYGDTKLAIEKMLKWTEKAHGLRYVTLRYFNVAGAYFDQTIGENHNPETHLIPNVLKSVLSNHAPLIVYGNDYPTKDGTPIRDYIHVEDLVTAHIKALYYLNENNASQTINLGSSEGYSVFDVIKTTERVINHPVKYTVKARRIGDPSILVASKTKAKIILNWEPTKDLKTMIESAYKYYKKHR